VAVIQRLAGPRDEELIHRLFASSRASELELGGLAPAQVEALLRMQLVARDRQYRGADADVEHTVVVVDGEDVAALWVARDGARIHLLDIAVLPEQRGRGIGTALIRELQEEAAATGCTLHLHVARTNAAAALYAHLGFHATGGDDMHQAMTWAPVSSLEAAG
jgi:ribosomal protein S18 acetylase RimI-like enzyme